MDRQALVSAFVSHLKSQTRELLARWYLKLTTFLPQFELKYKLGCQNTAADALSVMYVRTCSICNDEEDEVLVRIQAEQRKDKELSQIICYLDGNQKKQLKPRES